MPAIFRKLIIFCVPLLTISLMIIFDAGIAFSKNISNSPKIEKQEQYEIKVVFVDRGFTDQEEFLIEQAMIEWQNATKNRVQFFVKYNKHQRLNFKINHPNTTVDYLRIAPISSDDPLIELVDEAVQGTTVGFYDDKNFNEAEMISLYIVRDRIDSEQEYLSVATHEIGHTLLLEHSPDKRSLMYPKIHGRTCITQDDTDQFCEIHHCNSEDMVPCVSSITNGPVCKEKLENQINSLKR